MRVRSCILAAALLLPACASTQKTEPAKPAPAPATTTTLPVSRATEQPRDETIVTEEGDELVIRHGAKGSPAIVGCADGDREAFHDQKRFPKIAGCLASWSGAKNLRADPTGGVCGDELGECQAPADACAPNWHICGAAGELAELLQVTADQCEQAGGGRYSAAFSHCKTQEGCEYDTSEGATYPCFAEGHCSEPVCCGNDCLETGACADGLWPEQTHIPVGTDQGCGAMTARRAGGVLCCR